jgi:hypothetical protein
MLYRASKRAWIQCSRNSELRPGRPEIKKGRRRLIWRRPKDVGRLQSNTGWTSARLGWCCSHQNLTRGSLARAKAAANG